MCAHVSLLNLLFDNHTRTAAGSICDDRKNHGQIQIFFGFVVAVVVGVDACRYDCPTYGTYDTAKHNQSNLRQAREIDRFTDTHTRVCVAYLLSTRQIPATSTFSLTSRDMDANHGKSEHHQEKRGRRNIKLKFSPLLRNNRSTTRTTLATWYTEDRDFTWRHGSLVSISCYPSEHQRIIQIQKRSVIGQTTGNSSNTQRIRILMSRKKLNNF